MYNLKLSHSATYQMLCQRNEAPKLVSENLILCCRPSGGPGRWLRNKEGMMFSAGNPNKVGYKHFNSQSYDFKFHTKLPATERRILTVRGKRLNSWAM